MNSPGKAELVSYRITRARETLTEAEFLIQNGLLSTAVNRLYYACFYAVNALLYQNDINAKTHSGVKQMFSLHFVKTGLVSIKASDFYTVIFDMRHTGDYDDFIVFDKDEVIALLPPAIELVTQIERILSKTDSFD